MKGKERIETAVYETKCDLSERNPEVHLNGLWCINFSSAVLKEIIYYISRFSKFLYFGNKLKDKPWGIEFRKGEKWLKMRLTFRYKSDTIIVAKNVFFTFPSHGPVRDFRSYAYIVWTPVLSLKCGQVLLFFFFF